jgi:hypothetical protein
MFKVDMYDSDRHTQDAIKIAACVVAASENCLGYGSAHEINHFARDLYRLVTDKPWVQGWDGREPHD